MYRAGIEAILGFHVQGSHLLLTPCIPKHWPRFNIVYRYRSSRYEISVDNPDGVNSGAVHTALDGVTLSVGETRIALVDDGATHRIEMVLGSLCTGYTSRDGASVVHE